MNELKDKLIELFEDASFAPYTIEDLETITGVKREEIEPVLKELEKDYIIRRSKHGRYGLLKTFGLYKGVINVKEKGFGFIKCDDFDEEFFVPRDNINDAFNNDLVLFKVTNEYSEEKDIAYVVDIIERRNTTVVGTILKGNGHFDFMPITGYDQYHFEVVDAKMAVMGDYVKVKIEKLVNGLIYCNVVEIIGNSDDVGNDIKAIACKYDFYQGFNSDVDIELEKVVNEYNEKGMNEEFSRREFIDKTIITIDGETAKDLDDAVSCEKLSNGNYLLGVYIADVSYFVRENRAIDKEAFDRGTSVYLVDRVIPMLPHKLCNDLCSLNEHEKKLVTACIMEINPNGVVENYEIKEAVIETKHRMTYTSVNKILDGDKDEQEKYYDIVNDIFTMNKLAKILNKMRVDRGSLNFEVPEPEIIVNENGEVLDVRIRERYDGEKLIEEFMLIANETVACCIRDLDLPFIYRIHDVPNQEKLKKFEKILKNTKFKINVKKNQKITPKVLQGLLDEVNEEDSAISTMLLRLMAKAKYDVYNIGHYGLASECYTHFTSPIRRYPDLIVHRLLKKYLFRGEVSVEDQTETFNKLVNIAEQASKRERDAIECEYEVNDMKMAEYMKYHIGETYEGTINSVTNFGMFITLPNGIEGLVRLGSIKDDFYEYKESLMSLYGTRTNKVYRIGDKVKVKVKDSNKYNGQIDFELSLKKNQNMLKYSSQGKRDYHEKRRTYSRRKK